MTGNVPSASDVAMFSGDHCRIDDSGGLFCQPSETRPDGSAIFRFDSATLGRSYAVDRVALEITPVGE